MNNLETVYIVQKAQGGGYTLSKPDNSYLFGRATKLHLTESFITQILNDLEKQYNKTANYFKIAETPDDYEQARNNLKETHLTIPEGL